MGRIFFFRASLLGSFRGILLGNFLKERREGKERWEKIVQGFFSGFFKGFFRGFFNGFFKGFFRGFFKGL